MVFRCENCPKCTKTDKRDIWGNTHTWIWEHDKISQLFWDTQGNVCTWIGYHGQFSLYCFGTFGAMFAPEYVITASPHWTVLAICGRVCTWIQKLPQMSQNREERHLGQCTHLNMIAWQDLSTVLGHSGQCLHMNRISRPALSLLFWDIWGKVVVDLQGDHSAYSKTPVDIDLRVAL